MSDRVNTTFIQVACLKNNINARVMGENVDLFEHHYFWIVCQKYIKLYIFGKEMIKESHGDVRFLKKSQKFTFLPQFFCDNLEKNKFGVKKNQLAFHKEET